MFGGRAGGENHTNSSDWNVHTNGVAWKSCSKCRFWFSSSGVAARWCSCSCWGRSHTLRRNKLAFQTVIPSHSKLGVLVNFFLYKIIYFTKCNHKTHLTGILIGTQLNLHNDIRSSNPPKGHKHCHLFMSWSLLFNI